MPSNLGSQILHSGFSTPCLGAAFAELFSCFPGVHVFTRFEALIHSLVPGLVLTLVPGLVLG